MVRPPLPKGARLQLLDVGSEAGRGTCGGKRCIEQVAQQRTGFGIFHFRNLRTIGARCNSCSCPAIRRRFPFTTRRARRRCCCSAITPARPCPRHWAISASRRPSCRAISAGTSAASMPRSRSPGARCAAGRLGLFAPGDRLQPLAGRRGFDARDQRRHARAGEQGTDQGRGRCPGRGLLLALSPRGRPPSRPHDGGRPSGCAAGDDIPSPRR